MRIVPALLPFCFLVALVSPATAQLLEPETEEEKKTPSVYDRNEIPGHYTLGFYGDDRGGTGELAIAKEATEFDVWLGVTGDSTRVFSGLAMSLDLPPGVELAGPVIWTPRDRLKQFGNLLDPGITVEFGHDCAQQKSPAPVILARVRFRIQPGVNECLIIPAPHRRFGVSVELCSDERAWPKPYADPIGVTVKRKLSLWDRLTGWFN